MPDLSLAGRISRVEKVLVNGNVAKVLLTVIAVVSDEAKAVNAAWAGKGAPPQAAHHITITEPALFDAFTEGQKVLTNLFFLSPVTNEVAPEVATPSEPPTVAPEAIAPTPEVAAPTEMPETKIEEAVAVAEEAAPVARRFAGSLRTPPPGSGGSASS